MRNGVLVRVWVMGMWTPEVGKEGGFSGRKWGFLLARSWNVPEGPLGGGVGQVGDCDGLNSTGVGLVWRCWQVREILPSKGLWEPAS